MLDLVIFLVNFDILSSRCSPFKSRNAVVSVTDLMDFIDSIIESLSC